MSGTSDRAPADSTSAGPTVPGPTPDDARLMDVQQGGRCFLCGEPMGGKATYDHLIPRAYGGADVPGNVVLAHARCNKRKGDRLPTGDEIDRLVKMRRGSRLGIWPPLIALRDAPPEEEWIVLARAVAAAAAGG